MMRLKSNLFAPAVAAVVLAFAAVPAHATFDPGSVPGMEYTGLSYSAPYGATHRATVEGDIESTLAPGVNVSYVGRLNDVLNQNVSGGAIFDDSLDGACLDSGCTEGTWSFAAGLSNLMIAFIEISAAGGSKLYQLSDFAVAGVWNTHDLLTGGNTIPGLSHMDFYAAVPNSGTGGSPVPEPSTAALLALGVGAAAFSARLRRRQAR